MLQNSCAHAPLERVIARADVVERVQRSHVGPLCVHSPPCVFRASWCDGVDSSRTFSASLGHRPLGQANRRTFFSQHQETTIRSCWLLAATAEYRQLSSIRTSTKNVGLELRGGASFGTCLREDEIVRGWGVVARFLERQFIVMCGPVIKNHPLLRCYAALQKNTGELTAVLEALTLHGRHGNVPAEAQTRIFDSDFAAGVTLDTIQPEHNA